MRTAAVILVALAAAVIAATARAEATFTEHPRLTRAAGAVPGQVTETGAPGPARVYCWNEEAWRSAGWGGEADGFYDGFTELRWYICRPLLRSLRGWQPRLPERLLVARICSVRPRPRGRTCGGCGPRVHGGMPSADCLAAGHIRGLLRGLGQTRRQARRIEHELMGSGLGYEPGETESCWQPL